MNTPSNKQLTKNFNLREFDCKDGTPVPAKYIPNAQQVANNLQVLRDHLKKPVVISGSGYRTTKHNKAVGGAPKSHHLTCSAADISIKGMTPEQVAASIEYLISEGEMKQGGLGIYATFVHYDIRGHKARW